MPLLRSQLPGKLVVQHPNKDPRSRGAGGPPQQGIFLLSVSMFPTRNFLDNLAQQGAQQGECVFMCNLNKEIPR